MEDTMALLEIEEDECDGCDEDRECRDCICLGAFLIPPPDQGSYINIRALHHLGLGLLVSPRFLSFLSFFLKVFISNLFHLCILICCMLGSESHL